MYLYPIFDKFEVLDIFIMYKKEVKKQLEKKIKIVRFDRGEAYYDRYIDLGQQLGLFANSFKKECIIA